MFAALFRAPIVAVLVHLAIILASNAAAAGDLRIAIAWHDATAGKSFDAAIDAANPDSFTVNPIEVASDGVLRAGIGELLHVSRATGIVTRLDAHDLTVLDDYAIGGGVELRDAAIIDGETVWLSDRAGDSLLRLDLPSGAVSSGVELSPLGVATSRTRSPPSPSETKSSLPLPTSSTTRPPIESSGRFPTACASSMRRRAAKVP